MGVRWVRACRRISRRISQGRRLNSKVIAGFGGGEEFVECLEGERAENVRSFEPLYQCSFPQLLHRVVLEANGSCSESVNTNLVSILAL